MLRRYEVFKPVRVVGLVFFLPGGVVAVFATTFVSSRLLRGRKRSGHGTRHIRMSDLSVFQVFTKMGTGLSGYDLP